jgi:hypothetical protein
MMSGIQKELYEERTEYEREKKGKRVSNSFAWAWGPSLGYALANPLHNVR